MPLLCTLFCICLCLDLIQNYLTLDLCSGVRFCTFISSTAFQMCLTCQVPVWRLLLPLSKIWICFCFFDLWPSIFVHSSGFPVSSVLFWYPAAPTSPSRLSLGKKNDSHLEWQTVIGVQIARAWLWDITLFCWLQSHTNSSWCTGEDRAGRKWGEGAAPSTPLLPQKQKVLPYYSQISPCSLVPAIFFRRAKIKFACTSEKPGAFFWCHQTEALSALHFS